MAEFAHKLVIDPIERCALALQFNIVAVFGLMRNILRAYFRFCRKYLCHDYHSVAHQLESIHHCPVMEDGLKYWARSAVSQRTTGSRHTCLTCHSDAEAAVPATAHMRAPL